MGKSVYLVDYATVSYQGLYGISNINSGDEVVMFYYSEIDAIKDLVSAYEKKDIVLKYFKFERSKLVSSPFMISAYAGYAAADKDIERIVIISANEYFDSFFSVIDDLNPEVDIILERCIHNVFNPENRKPINATNIALLSTKAVNDVFESNETKEKKKAADSKEEAKMNKAAEKRKKRDEMKNTVKGKIVGYLPDEVLDNAAEIFVRCLEDDLSENKFMTTFDKEISGKNVVYSKSMIKKFYKKIKEQKEKK